MADREPYVGAMVEYKNILYSTKTYFGLIDRRDEFEGEYLWHINWKVCISPDIKNLDGSIGVERCYHSTLTPLPVNGYFRVL